MQLTHFPLVHSARRTSFFPPILTQLPTALSTNFHEMGHEAGRKALDAANNMADLLRAVMFTRSVQDTSGLLADRTSNDPQNRRSSAISSVYADPNLAVSELIMHHSPTYSLLDSLASRLSNTPERNRQVSPASPL